MKDETTMKKHLRQIHKMLPAERGGSSSGDTGNFCQCQINGNGGVVERYERSDKSKQLMFFFERLFWMTLLDQALYYIFIVGGSPDGMHDEQLFLEYRRNYDIPVFNCHGPGHVINPEFLLSLARKTGPRSRQFKHYKRIYWDEDIRLFFLERSQFAAVKAIEAAMFEDIHLSHRFSPEVARELEPLLQISYEETI